MQQLTIDRENAVKAYQSGTPKQKTLLENLFGKKSLFPDIIDAFDSYEEACELDGIKPLIIADFAFLPEKDREAQFASHQLDVMIRVVNDHKKFDYGNSNQDKYYPWLKWTGSGFALIGVRYAYTNSGVGPRRSFHSEETCRKFVTKFIHLYNQSYQQ